MRASGAANKATSRAAISTACKAIIFFMQESLSSRCTVDMHARDRHAHSVLRANRPDCSAVRRSPAPQPSLRPVVPAYPPCYIPCRRSHLCLARLRFQPLPLQFRPPHQHVIACPIDFQLLCFPHVLSCDFHNLFIFTNICVAPCYFPPVPKQTRHSPESGIPLSTFRMNTCKSVSKQRTLTIFRMNTYAKTGGSTSKPSNLRTC